MKVNILDKCDKHFRVKYYVIELRRNFIML